MSRITASPSVQSVAPADLARFTNEFCANVVSVVNGGLTFSDNFNAVTITCFFPTANTNTGFAHSLGFAPSGYVIVGLTASMIVFNGTTANSASTIYLQSSAKGTATVLIF